ncbi:unnamed protein product [Dovyalis caffra]|uniref:Uncharacterized protein n=1 Tax=Dovyalis caffra TaxID=77055 RepID=A0AAV1RH22_9ROSI|nr:unnamed protein product [Dovyalis caffra]
MESPCKESNIPLYESSKQEPSSKAIEVSVTKNIAQRVQKVESKGPLERRCSPRLRNIPKEKRPCYVEGQRMVLDAAKLDVCKKEVEVESTGPRERRPFHDADQRWGLGATKGDVCKKETGDHNRKRPSELPGDDASKRRTYMDHSMQEWLPNIDRKGRENGQSRSRLALGSLPFKVDDAEIELEDNAYLKWTDYQSFVADAIKQKASAAVKEAVRTFNSHCLNFAQVEEKRYEKVEVRDPQVANCTNTATFTISFSVSVSPSLEADLGLCDCYANPMKTLQKGNSSADAKRSSNQSILKEISEASILVGHKFFSRDDMVATGFRGHWLNGIDYIRKLCGKLNKDNKYSSPVAVAIMLSGQYQDSVDCSNEVVFTGQGRNDLNGSKRQIKDQVMHCSNLDLKNNMELSVPVRVILEHEYADSHSGKVYTYCGLYKVVRHWSVKKASGFSVSKYRLKRLQGQPKIEIDKSVQVARNVILPPSASGCDCKGKCTNPRSCSCARLNGFDFPYVRIDGGRLIEPKDVVFECGPGCSCGPSCINRVSQHGLKYRLEVYRTASKGWAVRSWDLIPSGAPVCEYFGILRRNDELDNVSENEFIFDIDCWHTMNGIGGRERRQGDGSVSACDPVKKADVKMDESESEFCLDAGSCGNVTRFINHSCMPNLFVQCVLSTHHDIRLARIVLFAADDILPMQELTYDYGYVLDSVVGPDGKVKQSPCYCGTDECRGRFILIIYNDFFGIDVLGWLRDLKLIILSGGTLISCYLLVIIKE